MSSSSPGLAPHGDADADADPQQASGRNVAPSRLLSDEASGPPWGSLNGQYRQEETRHSISSSSSSRLPIKKAQQADANTTTHADSDALQGPRRTPTRDSGGFLLDTLGHSAPALAPPSHAHANVKAKGKRRNEEAALLVPKRRLRTSLIGGSPLSREVRPDPQLAAEESTAPPSTTATSALDAHTLPHSKRNVNNNRNSTAPAAGLDADPAQIVNMALTLSQARKRIASEKRYVSAEQAQSRTISGASTASSRPQAQNDSIAQYLTLTTDTGQPSGGINPANTNDMAPMSTFAGSAEHSLPSTPVVVDDEGHPLQISPATAHRVQKVKNYFELAYEHRRLLSHLPPIARPGSRTPYQSKQYNPLQYIRNRKLRIWDRTTIDAEEDGWYDVLKVRDWVTSVIESHPETVHEPDECVRLPPLTKAAASGTESDSDAKRLKNTTPQKARRRRPRSDWVTHPGDLIADCFWLEQGVNKVKILDRDNRRIYPAKTQFRFSGWRNITPLEVPESVQRQQDAQQDTQQEAIPLPDQTEDLAHEHRPSEDAVVLPTFKSTHNQRHGHDGGKIRRRKDKVRRKGLKMFMDDSDSPSNSSRSPAASEEEADRGRKRTSKKRQKQAHNNDSFAAAALLQPTNPLSLSSGNSRASSAHNSSRLSIDHGLLAKLKRDSASGSTPNRSGNRNDKARQDSMPNVTRSSAEYDDSTAPNSPMANASKAPVWPSIVINLDSPPPSRAPSPAKKLRALNPFQDRSNPSKRDGVSRSDFAIESNEPSRQDREKAGGDSSGTSPMTRGTSPHTLSRNKSSVGAIDHPPNPLTSSKPASPPTGAEHQRIRGIFKGGRIAELVGTEVSRVGNFIWKRHPPASHSKQDSTSTSSLKSQRTYDSGDELEVNGSEVLKTPPVVRLQSSSSTFSTPHGSDKSPAVVVSRPRSSSADRPVYYNANLPSFTSPFQRDKEKQAQLATPSQANPDHISRQAAEHRSASRSPRLDHLAPPKLDMSRAASPARSNVLSLTSSYGFGEPIDLTNSQAASDKLNTMIRKSADNLTAMVSTQTPLDLSRVSSRDVTANEEPESVSTADIDRARALILSSAIKAAEIGRRADISRNTGPQLRLGLRSRGKGSRAVDLSLISRRREHVVAARNIVLTLNEQGATLDSKMKQFSSLTAPRLHRSLQALEDLVENKLTPRVRLSADEAGELSTKLNTSSALAVKNLNDAISRASRKRRRGPLRSIRRLFFAVTEYTVVALLWAIWAIVTVLTLFLRLVKGFIKLGKWMLFLE